MIYYNLNTINDWNFGDDNIIKVYKHGAVCYYKITNGETPTPVQEPCFAVVDDITRYQETEFEDVYDKATEKWFKLNNLNQYEEYGIYGSGRSVTTYNGKLTIDNGYEYEWNGSSWVNLGEVSGSIIPDNYVIPFEDSNVKAICVNNWGGNVIAEELTYGEAKQVTSLGSVFKHNNSITSFNELVYFKGLTSLDNGEFVGCTSLTDIVIPNNVRYLGYNSAMRATFSGCTNLSGVTMISGGDSLTTELTANNGSYYMNSSHANVPMVFPDREITMSGSTFGYYDYLTIVYFQSSTPPTNLANADINNYRKLANVYCPVGSLSAYQTALAGKNKTIQEYDFETDSLGLLDKEKEWASKTSTQTEYPKYYDEIQDPPDNLVFSSMEEAEAYECPWVGMHATIDGDKYVFSGDSQSGYEWVYNPSRLPIGYTEVEYVQNTGTSYFDTNFKPNTNTRILTEMQAVSSANYPRLFGAGAWNAAAGINLAYQTSGGQNCLHINWYGRTSWSYYTSFTFDYNKHTYDLNKNSLYRDETLVGSTSYTTSYQSTDNLGVFTYISGGRPSQSSYWGQEHFKGKMYSFKVYDNGTLVRDLVPCIKDSDNTVGAYDIVNDVFYTVPTGYTTDKLIAGGPV